MVLYGPNITTQSSSVCMPQPALTVSQLFMYNRLVRQREIATTSRPTTRHSQDRETPLPIYLGIMIHTRPANEPLLTWDCAFHIIGCWTSPQNLETKYVITMRWKKLSVLLNSRVACLQLPQWTILTTIPVLLVHTTRSMELGSPSSNIQMTLSLGFSGMLLPI